MTTCTYSFTDPLTKQDLVLKGQPEIKNYLFNGGLEALLPDYGLIIVLNGKKHIK